MTTDVAVVTAATESRLKHQTTVLVLVLTSAVVAGSRGRFLAARLLVIPTSPACPATPISTVAAVPATSASTVAAVAVAAICTNGRTVGVVIATSGLSAATVVSLGVSGHLLSAVCLHT